MAAAANDIIRITDIQTLFGQEVLNVYFYQVNNVTPLIGDYLAVFGEWFHDTILTPLIALQTSDLVHTSLFLENISNGVDIESFTTDFPVPGASATSDTMPPFVSWGFQLLREERNTRNGYKRFAGVPEIYVTDGVASGAGGLITAVEDVLGEDVVVGIATVAAPVILKRPFTVPLVSPVVSNISAGLFKGIGTQNTRKFGRGS